MELAVKLYLQVYRIQDIGYICRIQDTGCTMQDRGYRIQDRGYRIQDTGYRYDTEIKIVNGIKGPSIYIVYR